MKIYRCDRTGTYIGIAATMKCRLESPWMPWPSWTAFAPPPILSVHFFTVVMSVMMMVVLVAAVVFVAVLLLEFHWKFNNELPRCCVDVHLCVDGG